MAYTNVWNTNSPPGSQAANTADDEFRKFRLDLEERMEDKFIADVVQDPWQVKPEILGNVSGKKLAIHHSAFSPTFWFDGSLSLFTRSDLFLQHNLADGVARQVWAPLIFPLGVTVSDITFLVNRNGGSNMTLKLIRTNFTLIPAINTEASGATAVNGISLPNLGALAHAVIASDLYALEVTFPASQESRLYGAVVTYNTPDCRNTL